MKKIGYFILVIVIGFILVSCQSNNIVNFKYNDQGDLIGIYEDGTEENFGNNKDDGYEIVSYHFNDKDELIIKYKNGKEINLGKIKDDDKEEIEIENEVLYDDFVLRKDVDNTYRVKSYLGNDTDIVIPDDYNGIPITSISSFAIYLFVEWEGSSSKERINLTIGKNIKTINTLGIISENLNINLMFAEDSKLEYLEPIAIQAQIVNKLVLPEGLISIGSHSFAYDGYLKIPNSLVYINDLGSSKLFLYTSSDKINPGWSSENSYLFDIVSEGQFEDLDYLLNSNNEITIIGTSLKEIEELIIPDEINGAIVKTIGDLAFYNKNINKLTLGKNIKYINDLAFYGNSLESIIIHKTVNRIGRSAFSSNIKLTTVTIEEESKLEVIDNNVFSQTSVLRIKIPSTVIEVGSNILPYNNYPMFSKSYLYTELLELPEKWDESENNYVLGVKDYLNDEHFEYTLNLNDELIVSKVLKYEEFNEIKILDSFNGYEITEIGEYVFSNIKISKLTLGANVKIIKEGAFKYSEIPSFEIPEYVEIIEKYAFDNVYSYDRTILTTKLKKRPIGWHISNEIEFGIED